jgi:type IV secretory pathway TrbF-like protein
MDLSRAVAVDEEVVRAVDDLFDYHSWDEAKKERGALVKHALVRAVLTIIDHVPPCPDRSAAIRKIREARMDCNSAITHDGKY